MRGADWPSCGRVFSVQSGTVATFAIAERQTAFTAPGAAAPGQLEEVK